MLASNASVTLYWRLTIGTWYSVSYCERWLGTAIEDGPAQRDLRCLCQLLGVVGLSLFSRGKRSSEGLVETQDC